MYLSNAFIETSHGFIFLVFLRSDFVTLHVIHSLQTIQLVILIVWSTEHTVWVYLSAEAILKSVSVLRLQNLSLRRDLANDSVPLLGRLVSLTNQQITLFSLLSCNHGCLVVEVHRAALRCQDTEALNIKLLDLLMRLHGSNTSALGHHKEFMIKLRLLRQ